jgi:hypothetical protein
MLCRRSVPPIRRTAIGRNCSAKPPDTWAPSCTTTRTAASFLTIDRWRTEQDWLAFRATFGVDYEALDARLAGLSARETSLFEGSSEEL